MSSVKYIARAGLAIGVLMSFGTALACHNQTVCHSKQTSSHTLPRLSSWTPPTPTQHVRAVSTSTRHVVAPTLRTRTVHHTPAPVVQTRTVHRRVVPFTGRTLPRLNAGETLVPTQCPVSVNNPQGGKVLGCYNVARPVIVPPVLVQRPVRVVHPIIYVRYPVPVPVYATPVYRACGGWHSGASRYGYGPRAGCRY